MQPKPPPVTLSLKKRRAAADGDAKDAPVAPSRKGQAEGPADKAGAG